MPGSLNLAMRNTQKINGFWQEEMQSSQDGEVFSPLSIRPKGGDSIAQKQSVEVIKSYMQDAAGAMGKMAEKHFIGEIVNKELFGECVKNLYANMRQLEINLQSRVDEQKEKFYGKSNGFMRLLKRIFLYFSKGYKDIRELESVLKNFRNKKITAIVPRQFHVQLASEEKKEKGLEAIALFLKKKICPTEAYSSNQVEEAGEAHQKQKSRFHDLRIAIEHAKSIQDIKTVEWNINYWKDKDSEKAAIFERRKEELQRLDFSLAPGSPSSFSSMGSPGSQSWDSRLDSVLRDSPKNQPDVVIEQTLVSFFSERSEGASSSDGHEGVEEDAEEDKILLGTISKLQEAVEKSEISPQEFNQQVRPLFQALTARVEERVDQTFAGFNFEENE